MTKIKERLAKLFFFVFASSLMIFAFCKAYNKWVDGFYLKNIYITTEYNPQWEIAYSKEDLAQVNAILSKPFYYLAKGRQCYSFESEDGQYVIKFLKCQRMKLPEVCDWVCFPDFLQSWKERKENEKLDRLHRLFTSYYIAREVLPYESGVLFIHLNRTKCIDKKVCLVNKAGMQYELDMNEVPFAIQRKADMVLPTLEALISKGKIDQAKVRLDQIIETCVSRVKKGISDIDGSWIVRNNVGFLSNQAVHVDIGTFAYSNEINSKQGIEKDLRKLKPLVAWLHQRDQMLEEYLVEKMKEAVAQF